jgi:predicted amidophosphoribosyltransferase
MRPARRDPNRCPQCGERVLPLAAGCSLCGASLDITRYDRGPGPLQRLGSWFGAVSYGPRISVGAFVAVAIGAYVVFQFLG